MNKHFVKAWDENKHLLEEYIKTHNQDEYDDYEELVKLVIEKVLNNYKDLSFKTDDIVEIDFGDYQGTLIYVFHEDICQPDTDETFYTSVDYGSCSGCDTLQSINDYSNELPTEDQVKQYMDLCLHLIQNIKCFGDVDSNWTLINLDKEIIKI